MSNAVFPTLPGLSITVKKEPEFDTIIQRAVSGKELRIGQRVYPLWYHTLSFNFLRDTAAYPELKALGEFYLNRYAALDSFLFTDPDDYTVSNQTLGTGNGSNRDFQLVRPFGSHLEPVYNPNTITDVKVAGVSAGYVLQSNGVVRMNTAPANGAAVTATFTYYFRCRFLKDRLSLEKFLHQVWKTGTVEMVGSLQNKIN